MSQLVKCLLCKHKDLSSTPTTQVKSWILQPAHVTSVLWEREELETSGFLKLNGQPI